MKRERVFFSLSIILLICIQNTNSKETENSVFTLRELPITEASLIYGLAENHMDESEAVQKTPMMQSPKPTYQVLPVYPYELRRKEVRGEVKLRFLLDKSGKVINVDVIRSLHPYLDYAVARALLQWKFEPVLREGKPVPVTSIFTFDFSPEKYTLIDRSVLASESFRSEADFASQNELRSVLDKCAEYCRKLTGSALDFVCEESIKETHRYLDPEENPRTTTTQKEARGRNMDGTAWYYGVISRYRAKYKIRPEKNRYLCDYQLIKSGNQIEEQRIILKEGSKKISLPKKRLEEKRFLVLRPLFSAIMILGRGSQDMFAYAIVDEAKISGKKAYIIEAVPKYQNIGSVEKARIWVNKQNAQILKIVINGVPLEGYDDVWQDAVTLAIKPKGILEYTFESERNGIMFPKKSSVRIEYPEVGLQESIEKVKIDIRYDKYKYFTVETEHEIKKK